MISIHSRGYEITADLVLPMEVIRNDTARRCDDDIDRVFAQTGIGCLFECILSRASLPNRPVDIAPLFSLMEVKKIHERSPVDGILRMVGKGGDQPDLKYFSPHLSIVG